MEQEFGKIIEDGVSMLIALPRTRDAVSEARVQLNSFRQAHPHVRADLLVDQPPLSARIDYDLLLQNNDKGTVALSWRPDDATPWALNYAEHWAANLVLSVNDRRISVQDALLLFKLARHEESGLLDKLLSYALIQDALREHPQPVHSLEIQAAADRFRISRDLYSAETTHQWLKETGLTPKAVEKFLAELVQTRKLKKSVVRGRVEDYFEQHKDELDTVQVFEVTTATMMMASKLASQARAKGLLMALHERRALVPAEDENLEGVLVSRCAGDQPLLPPKAGPGTVTGPTLTKSKYSVAEVVNRYPAKLDARTRAAIENTLFQEWLNQRRKQVDVRWHLCEME